MQLVVEAWRTVVAARGYSALFLILSLVSTVAVVLLVGQAQAQARNVHAQFERPGLRTVEVVDADGAGVLPADVAALARLYSPVERSWAVGQAFEVGNAALPDRGKVSARAVAGTWDDLPVDVVSGRKPQARDEALVPEGVDTQLGIDASGGVLERADGVWWTVVGTYRPQHDRAPTTVLVPGSEGLRPRSVFVTVRTASEVEPAAQLVASLAESTLPGSVTVERAVATGALQAGVSSTVARYGDLIVVTVMAAAWGILAFLAVLMVYARRQEFGRRRALGATRGAVVALVVLQGATVVLIGSLAGTVLGSAIVVGVLGGVPNLAFLGAVIVAMVCGAVLAQLPSAFAAGLRDPVRVLRTP